MGEITENEIDKKTLELLKKADFFCQRCSVCCRHDPGAVFLTDEDLSAIASFFSVSREEIINEYCRTISLNTGNSLSLREKANYDCVFWEGVCKIYEARPLQCRTYPFWPYLVESRSRWLDESKRCEGINKEGGMPLSEKIKLYLMEKNAKHLRNEN